MGFWSSLLKTGGKAISYGGKATVATGKSVGNAVLHPSQTLRGIGSALKTVTVGGAAGYVGWEKLTTDKSVARIVSDAVIGEEATNAISGTVKSTGDKVSRITDKAEQTMANVNQATNNLSSTLNGASNFLGNVSNRNGGDMLGNFLNNLANGKVSGMGIAGLIAGAFLVFGRFGWLGKIAGAFLMMMTIGNHANLLQENTVANTPRQTPSRQEEQTHSGGMRR